MNRQKRLHNANVADTQCVFILSNTTLHGNGTSGAGGHSDQHLFMCE